ncbi:N-acetylmuramoyl-L-alanine amidase [Nocardioides sp. TF02-7]|uniref:N-acetylmuramoyl-L-alanine amidase n=1 Tax=Nocardioides sp. TF02-7 TaxID=2917724 RepID=UPI001F06A3AE|nr:N-acetylmuramoyl-L-alanine amidase [Nocardioides sp. TF02-7]UMG93191.1 N-acetylmuramoyl-L-alanine amidase [Nocardioides sp. TF02-7]
MRSSTSRSSDRPAVADPARRRQHFVVACQQVLALALVCAVLTPAARTITMDVRPAGPGAADVGGPASLRSAQVPSTVPTAPVDPAVEEYTLTAPKGARVAPRALRSTVQRTAGGSRLTSDAVPVDGYGTVGVTWGAGARVEDDALAVRARTLRDGRWSGWAEVPFHDEHGPDPDSREGRRARPGTEPLVVGDADRVQVRVVADAGVPADMRLAVIEPGTASSTARELPSIDTSTLPGSAPGSRSDQSDQADRTSPTQGGDGAITLQAKVAAPRPTIFSRAQWGANERLRDPGSLHYYEVHAGFVHHTVNTNDYTRAQVPGIIRSIYAYHTRSRGWSDIGYNFLVDRFGRVWEGRAGGVDRPVVGAHTLGYNEESFAMSAIGNFETARPTAAMIRAYGALFAWKLGLHGVDAADQKQRVGSRNFPAINGHRDAGSTACPGRYLYAKLGRIRNLAAAAQTGWEGRELESDLVGDPGPDLVFRRKSDGRAILRSVERRPDGRLRLGKPLNTGLDLSSARALLRAGDWDRDGHGDLIVRHHGRLWLHRGLGGGKFAPESLLAKGFGKVRLLAAVGDYTGDGFPDLVGQPIGGRMQVYPGRGREGAAGGAAGLLAGPGPSSARHRPVGRRRRAGHDRPHRLGARALPRQRTWWVRPRHGPQDPDQRLQLDGRHRRRRRWRPQRPGGPHEGQRPAVARPREHRPVPAPRPDHGQDLRL